MPVIDDGGANGPSGNRLRNAWVELTPAEARDLLESLQAWEEEIRDGVLDPGWHTHVTDEDGNELTVAISLAASDELARATALDRAAELLDQAVWPALDVTTDERTPIEAIAIVRFPGRGILVLDGEGTWWMGQPNASSSEIHCWGPMAERWEPPLRPFRVARPPFRDRYDSLEALAPGSDTGNLGPPNSTGCPLVC